MHEPTPRPDSRTCRALASRQLATFIRFATAGLLAMLVQSIATGLPATCVLFIASSLLAPSAQAACTPTSPANGATVTCTGTDSTGYDGSGADDLTIVTNGVVILDDSDPGLDAAILVDDDSTVTIGVGAIVRVTEQNGAGIRGDDDNFVENRGGIELQVDDTRGIVLDQNTTGILPNGAVNSGTIQVDGNRSYAIETGDNTGVANSGTIELDGNETRGLSGGSRLDYTKPANVTNSTTANVPGSGTINVRGDDSYGMKFGDGWLDGSIQGTPGVFVPSAAGIRNQTGATIRVEGARSFGIFAGDESNLDGDHNSFIVNSGTIAVTGTDATALSTGGNSRLSRLDLSTVNVTNSSSLGLVSLNNAGTISGDADAGPLVVFRNFHTGNENRLLNSGSILADTTNQGTANRSIAIRGSDGDELVFNTGRIDGDVDLAGGDDRYFHRFGAQAPTRLFGGAGQDEVTLAGLRSQSGSTETFDLGRLQGFEAVRITRGAPLSGTGSAIWRLSNSGGFTGLVDIQDNALLDVPTPISLGGGLTVADDAAIRVTLDGTTPPLTIAGPTTLDGFLEVVQGTSLTPSATPYQVVLASGGYTGRFSEIIFPSASGTRIFTPIYDATGLLALFQDVGLVGVASGANQRAIAGHLTDLIAAGGSQTDLQTFLAEADDIQDLSPVFDALSPEAYDAQTTVSVEAGRRIAAMLFDRPRECRSGEFDPWTSGGRVLPCHARWIAPWVATLGSFRDRDAFSGHAQYEAQLGGLIAGVDFQPLAGLDLTLAVSTQGGQIDFGASGESSLTLAELTGAAAWSIGDLRVQGAVSWGHGFHEDRRLIRFAGATPTTAVDRRGSEDHESDRTLLATEIGYRIPAGPVGVEPLVGFDWAWVEQDEIRESGAGGFGLDVEQRDDEVGSVRAGLRLSTIYEHKAYLGPWLEWMTGLWRPSLDVAWRQYLEGTERDLSARFQGAPDTAGGFTIQGEEDEGGAEIGVGFRLIPSAANRLRFDVRYQAYVAEHTLEHDLTGQLAISF